VASFKLKNNRVPNYLSGHFKRMKESNKQVLEKEIHFCACGCGGIISFKPQYAWMGWAKFLRAHAMQLKPKWNKGLTKNNNALLKKMSEAKLGISPANKGIPMSPELKKKVSDSIKEGFKKGRIVWNKNKPMSETPGYYENSKKAAIENGKKFTGENNPFYGKKHTAESLKIMGIKSSLANKGRKILWVDKLSGKYHWNWQGGISDYPYPKTFNSALKNIIRKRDNFVCRLCGITQESKLHAVHHIDYDKFNIDISNLITLCISCHAKTNKNREHWKLYFKNLLNYNKENVA